MYVHIKYSVLIEKLESAMDEKVMMTFRLEKSLRNDFDAAAQVNDQSSSQLLRAFMREYVKKNAPFVNARTNVEKATTA